jgi:hypothetical protein
MVKKILLVILVLLLLSQFFQPSKNNGSAASATDITHAIAVPDSIERLLSTACYDCHSNHTNYPWYSRITPVNWWLRNHINEGKRELNFSVFASYNNKRKMKKLEEVAKQVKEHEMPISSYLWIHNEAKLSDAQRQLLVDWATAAREKVLQDSLAAH